MRHFSLLVLMMFAIAGVGPVTAQKKQRPATRPPHANAEQTQQMEDDKAAIQKLHDEDIRASLALDAPALETLWTDDIVTMAPGAPAVAGKEANIQKLEAGIADLKTMEILSFDEQWQ